MIKNLKGDATKQVNTFLCHQTNCCGVMGAGIAKTIKQNILTPEQYSEYVNLCNTRAAAALLGTVQYFSCPNNVIVANCFAENIPGACSCDTEYHKLFDCLQNVRDKAMEYAHGDMSVTIPKFIGCGLAGGNWNIVYPKILVPLFADSEITLNIVEWQAN